MKRVALLSVVAVLLCQVAFAADKLIVVSSKGRGASREAAIKQGIVEAVGKAKGITVESGDFTFGFGSSSAGMDMAAGKSKVEFQQVSVGVEGTSYKTDIAGLVKSYEVVDEKQVDANTYEVSLKVEVYDYESVDATKRIRVAVMPVETEKERYQIGGFNAPADYVAKQLSHKLSIGLTQANKFAVLDREYIAKVMQEKSILLSKDAPLEEKAKLGKALGADYILVGTVSEAGLKIKDFDSTIIGRPLREYEADFVFDYRLMAAATRSVKVVDSVTIHLDETEDIKKLVREWKAEDVDYKEILDNLISKVAGEAINNILDSLYPIRIATVDKDGNVVINQGGKRIVKGMLLEVFEEGEEIFDDDTKESLGRMEAMVGTISIERVAAKMSYGKVVKGDAAKVSKGMICRIQKVEEPKVKSGKSDIIRTEQGGIKLPFDK